MLSKIVVKIFLYFFYYYHDLILIAINAATYSLTDSENCTFGPLFTPSGKKKKPNVFGRGEKQDGGGWGQKNVEK